MKPVEGAKVVRTVRMERTYDTLAWVNMDLTTTELELRLLALTDAECAKIVK